MNAVKLRTKLIISFIIFMVTLMSLGGMAYIRMSNMQEQINTFYYTYFDKYKAANYAITDINAIGRTIGNILINEEENYEAIKLEVDRLSGRVLGSMEYINSRASIVDEEKAIETFRQDWTKYSQFVYHSLMLLEKGKWQEAKVLRTEVGVNYQETLLASTEKLANLAESMMEEQLNRSERAYSLSINAVVITILIGFILTVLIILWVIPSVIRNLNILSNMMTCLSRGRLRTISKFKPHTRDEIGNVIEGFKVMALDLDQKNIQEQEYRRLQQEQAWIDSNVAKLTELMFGVTTIEQAASTFIQQFTPVLGAQYAVLYIREEDADHPIEQYRAYGWYAARGELEIHPVFKFGEGLVGQCAADKFPIVVHDLDEHSIQIESGMTNSTPTELKLYPILFEQKVIGILEIASLQPLSEINDRLLEHLGSNLAVIINMIIGRVKVDQLLRDSQALTEELQCQSEELLTQQEELRRSNEYLESQTYALRRSEELLQRQQEELEHYNNELISKTKAIEENMIATKQKNEELELARTALERQTLELALASKYKSEFLANMSHELRTPLNSMLVLSQLLAENKEQNLQDKQIEYARTINMSGVDLLSMIDEILDLSKIDAGQMNFSADEVQLAQFCQFMKNSFLAIAEQKGLQFEVKLADDVPSFIYTDEYRLKQIVRNLLSNAFKFTKSGSVHMCVNKIQMEDGLKLMIRVEDTGIGIPAEKQKIIFEAFQQLDGTTSRLYGGAGLGLSISRELSYMLGGQLTVDSEEGCGSIFTLVIPFCLDEEEWQASQEAFHSKQDSEVDKLIQQVSSTQLWGGSEPVQHSEMKEEGEPGNVLEIDPEKHPVDVNEESQVLDLNVSDPVSEQTEETASASTKWILVHTKLLIVEADEPQRESLIALLESDTVSVIAVSTAEEALEILNQEWINVMILDLTLPNMSGYELIHRIAKCSEWDHMPIIVYTGLTLRKTDEQELSKRVSRIIIKDSQAPERLLQETVDLINRLEPEELTHELQHNEILDPQLSGKRVLIVDDDVRNVFALSSMLEQYHMDIEYAENGYDAIQMIYNKPDYDIVLMDMMMPEIDGYEAMRRIRENPKYQALPIIALTAKAMKEDRKRCIEAGASDYISKPFQTEQLLSLMRVWIYNND